MRQDRELAMYSGKFNLGPKHVRVANGAQFLRVQCAAPEKVKSRDTIHVSEDGIDSREP